MNRKESNTIVYIGLAAAAAMLLFAAFARGQNVGVMPCATTEVKPAAVADDKPITLEINVKDLLEKYGGSEVSRSSGDSKGASQSAKGTDIKGQLDSSAPEVSLPGGQRAKGGDASAQYEAELRLPEPQTVRILLAVIGVVAAAAGGFLIYRGVLGLGLGVIGGGLFLIASAVFPVIWWILGLLGIAALVVVGVLAFIKYAGSSKIKTALQEVIDGVAALKPDPAKYLGKPNGEADYAHALAIYEAAKAAQSNAQSKATQSIVADYKVKEGA